MSPRGRRLVWYKVPVTFPLFSRQNRLQFLLGHGHSIEDSQSASIFHSSTSLTPPVLHDRLALNLTPNIHGFFLRVCVAFLDLPPRFPLLHLFLRRSSFRTRLRLQKGGPHG